MPQWGSPWDLGRMGSKELEKGDDVPCHLPVHLGDTEDVPSWEAEHGWDKARHSLGTPLLPAQTARGVCTSGLGGSPLAVTPWWWLWRWPEPCWATKRSPGGRQGEWSTESEPWGQELGTTQGTQGFGSKGSAAPTALPLVHDPPGSARGNGGHGDKNRGGHGEDRAWKAQGTHLWHGLAPASGQLLLEEPAWSRQL